MLWCHSSKMQHDCNLKIYKIIINHKQRFRSQFILSTAKQTFIFLSQSRYCYFGLSRIFCCSTRSGHKEKILTVPPFWLPDIQLRKYRQSIFGPVNGKLSLRSGNTGSGHSGRMNSSDESRAWRERRRSSVGEWQPDRGMAAERKRRRGREMKSSPTGPSGVSQDAACPLKPRPLPGLITQLLLNVKCST